MDKSLLMLLLVAVTTIGGNLYGTVNKQNLQKLLFQQWQNNIGVHFQGNQIIYRFKIFQNNIDKINQFNSKIGKRHSEELNQFAFLTQQEFKQQYLFQFSLPPSEAIIDQDQQQVDEDNGPTIDWVAYGAVSPIKNQGQCLASYAFSAVGGIEGIGVIYFNITQEFSAQQIVDCSLPYGNAGCQGGNMQNSFNFIRDQGIYNETTYRYRGDFGPCQNKSGLIFKIPGYNSVSSCSDLADALTGRPISVAVDGQNFQFYRSGIFSDCGTNLSLATLLVGMTDTYWKLKNCWGTSWGQGGYIRIARGNTCGVCSVGSYPRAF